MGQEMWGGGFFVLAHYPYKAGDGLRVATWGIAVWHTQLRYK